MSGPPQTFREFSLRQLKDYLENTKKFDSDEVDVFVQHKFDGNSFLSLKDKDLDKLGLKMGTQFKIRSCIQDIKKQEQERQDPTGISKRKAGPDNPSPIKKPKLIYSSSPSPSKEKRGSSPRKPMSTSQGRATSIKKGLSEKKWSKVNSIATSGQIRPVTLEINHEKLTYVENMKEFDRGKGTSAIRQESSGNVYFGFKYNENYFVLYSNSTPQVKTSRNFNLKHFTALQKPQFANLLESSESAHKINRYDNVEEIGGCRTLTPTHRYWDLRERFGFELNVIEEDFQHRSEDKAAVSKITLGTHSNTNSIQKVSGYIKRIEYTLKSSHSSQETEEAFREAKELVRNILRVVDPSSTSQDVRLKDLGSTLSYIQGVIEMKPTLSLEVEKIMSKGLPFLEERVSKGTSVPQDPKKTEKEHKIRRTRMGKFVAKIMSDDNSSSESDTSLSSEDTQRPSSVTPNPMETREDSPISGSNQADNSDLDSTTRTLGLLGLLQELLADLETCDANNEGHPRKYSFSLHDLPRSSYLDRLEDGFEALCAAGVPLSGLISLEESTRLVITQFHRIFKNLAATKKENVFDLFGPTVFLHWLGVIPAPLPTGEGIKVFDSYCSLGISPDVALGFCTDDSGFFLEQSPLKVINDRLLEMSRKNDNVNKEILLSLFAPWRVESLLDSTRARFGDISFLLISETVDAQKGFLGVPSDNDSYFNCRHEGNIDVPHTSTFTNSSGRNIRIHSVNTESGVEVTVQLEELLLKGSETKEVWYHAAHEEDSFECANGTFPLSRPGQDFGSSQSFWLYPRIDDAIEHLKWMSTPGRSRIPRGVRPSIEVYLVEKVEKDRLTPNFITGGDSEIPQPNEWQELVFNSRKSRDTSQNLVVQYATHELVKRADSVHWVYGAQLQNIHANEAKKCRARTGRGPEIGAENGGHLVMQLALKSPQSFLLFQHSFNELILFSSQNL